MALLGATLFSANTISWHSRWVGNVDICNHIRSTTDSNDRRTFECLSNDEISILPRTSSLSSLSQKIEAGNVFQNRSALAGNTVSIEQERSEDGNVIADHLGTYNFHHNNRKGENNGMDDSQHRPYLYLHVGPPKTGTTSLQKALEQNIDLLAADDIVYLGKFITSVGADSEKKDDTRTRNININYSSNLAFAKKFSNAFHRCQYKVSRIKAGNAQMFTKQREKMRCWKNIGKRFDELSQQGKHVILSDEIFSHRHAGWVRWLEQLHQPNLKDPIDDDTSTTGGDFTLPLPTAESRRANSTGAIHGGVGSLPIHSWQFVHPSMLRNFNIVIVAAYRRLYEWLPSVKYQLDLPLPHKPATQQWPKKKQQRRGGNGAKAGSANAHSAKSDIKRFVTPQWETLYQWSQTGQTIYPNASHVVRIFSLSQANPAGTGTISCTVKLLNMYSARGMYQEFFCDLCGHDTQVCRQVKIDEGLEVVSPSAGSEVLLEHSGDHPGIYQESTAEHLHRESNQDKIQTLQATAPGKKLRERVFNKASDLNNLDDYLALHAANAGLIDTNQISRTAAAKAIAHFYEEILQQQQQQQPRARYMVQGNGADATTNDHPVAMETTATTTPSAFPPPFSFVCPPTDEAERYLERSLQMEEELFPNFYHSSPLGKVEHERRFWQAVGTAKTNTKKTAADTTYKNENSKYCNLNLTAIFENEAWRTFFQHVHEYQM